MVEARRFLHIPQVSTSKSTMCRLQLLVACVAGTSLVSPAEKNSVCHAIAGTYEGFTTRVAVHEDHMYMAQANSVTHSKGSIIASTDCSCSGVVNFTGTEMFNWQYNLWTCELKWTKNPTHDQPHVEEVNIWQRDGSCKGPPGCNPEKDMDGLRLVSIQSAQSSANKTLAAGKMVVQYGTTLKNAADQILESAPSNIRVRQAAVDAAKAIRLASEAVAQISQSLSIPRNNSVNLTADLAAPPPTALLGLPKAGGVAAKRRVFKRRAMLVEQHQHRFRREPSSQLATGCAAMSGDYENGASIIDVHPEGVFVASSQGTPSAQGEVTQESMCKCSGDMMFGELGQYQFLYDAFTCSLTWLTVPTLAAPVSTATNVWKRDSDCKTRVACDPEVLKAKLGLPAVPPLAADIGLASVLGGLQIARAINILAEAAKIIVTQAALVTSHGHGTPQITAAANSVPAALAMGKQAANDVFEGVAVINARAARETCRTPLLATVQSEDFAKAHVASLPAV